MAWRFTVHQASFAGSPFANRCQLLPAFYERFEQRWGKGTAPFLDPEVHEHPLPRAQWINPDTGAALAVVPIWTGDPRHRSFGVFYLPPAGDIWCLINQDWPQTAQSLWAALKQHRINPVDNRLPVTGPAATDAMLNGAGRAYVCPRGIAHK